MGGAHAEGSQTRETRAHTSHRGAAVLALVVGAVALVCAALVLGTLYGPRMLRAYVPSLADDLGILVEPEPELERLNDGYDGELARRVAAVSAELTRSAYDTPDLDEATAGALQGLLLAADDHGRYLTEDEYRALTLPASGGAANNGGTADSVHGAGATDGGMDEKRWFGPVAAWLDGTMGVVEVASLAPGAAEHAADAIAFLEEKGAKTLTLDLTDNAGGSLNEAVALTSLFLNGGTVGELIEPDGTARRLRVNAGARVTDAPLAVLVSQDTGSAAELVVGALKDHRRALVVGATTAGRGTVQSVKTLSFGGAVVYATAEFLTPDGYAVEGVGIVPDFNADAVGDVASDEGAVDGGNAVDSQVEGAEGQEDGGASEQAPDAEGFAAPAGGSAEPTEPAGSTDSAEREGSAVPSDVPDALGLAHAALNIWLETGRIEDVLRLDVGDLAEAIRRTSVVQGASAADADADAGQVADASDGGETVGGEADRDADASNAAALGVGPLDAAASLDESPALPDDAIEVQP